jgi:hypothetical protein
MLAKWMPIATIRLSTRRRTLPYEAVTAIDVS